MALTSLPITETVTEHIFPDRVESIINLTSE